MKLSYDGDYTNTFHSPGIEPWVMGLLKNRGPLGRVLDLGCGLGFMGFLLKQYLNSVEYLVGIDISSDRVEKAKRLNLYDELYVADVRYFTCRSYFDTLIAIEVLHGLEPDVIGRVERFVRRGGLVVMTLPSLPQGVTVKDLINRGYNVYRCLLRGLLLIDLKNYSIHLAEHSRFLKAVKILLMLLRPLLRMTKLLERGYLIAFKEV